jgi:outer membrane protein
MIFFVQRFAAVLVLFMATAVGTTHAEDLGGQGFEAAFQAALTHDPGLQQAYWINQSYQEDDDISVAKLRPDIRLAASYLYENSDNIYTEEDSSFYDPDQERSSGELVDYLWRVSLRQPVFDYSLWEEYQGSKASTSAAEFRYQRERQELIYRVAEQFLFVLLAAQEVFLNEQKLDALTLKKAQVERAQALGIGDQLSILSVNANRDLARSDLLQAKSDLSDARTKLANLVGIEINFPPHWIGSSKRISPDLLSGSEESWLENVVNNLNVKEAQASIRQAEHNLTASKGQHYPTVDLSLSYLDRTSEDEFRTRKDAIAAIELSMPLYSGGSTQASVRKARAKLEASQAALDNVLAEKIQQVKLSYNRLLSYKDRLAALAESRESGKGYLEAAERQLSLNLTDQVTVLDARTQLVDTQLRFAETLMNYLLADLILRLETGFLDEARLRDYDRLFDVATQ